MSVITDFATLLDSLGTTSGSALANGQISTQSQVGTGSVNYSSNATTLPTTTTGTSQDFRLRLSYLSTSSMNYNGIMSPLTATTGLMFPYTPTISMSQSVDYETMTMTHSNTNYLAYSRSPNVDVSIQAKFSVQNQNEGLYALAALQFLRACSKMYFGETDAASGLAGTPPPILELNGYGTYMFNKVRCILKRHSYSFDEGMQMVNIVASNGYVRLPALFTIQLELATQTTARAQRQDFNLADFASGALMENAPNNSGWI